MSIFRKLMMTSSIAGGEITFIDSKTFTDDVGDFSVDITDMTFSADDVMLVAFSSDFQESSMGITGFTELYDSNSSFPQACLYVKKLVGNETSVDTTTAASLDAVSGIIAVYRGCNTPTSADLASSSGGTGMPSSPASHRDTNTGDVVLAIGYLDDDAVTATAPTNYTLIETINHTAGTYITSTMMASRTGVSGTQTPGVFGGGGDDAWYANTLILAPEGWAPLGIHIAAAGGANGVTSFDIPAYDNGDLLLVVDGTQTSSAPPKAVGYAIAVQGVAGTNPYRGFTVQWKIGDGSAETFSCDDYCVYFVIKNATDVVQGTAYEDSTQDTSIPKGALTGCDTGGTNLIIGGTYTTGLMATGGTGYTVDSSDSAFYIENNTTAAPSTNDFTMSSSHMNVSWILEVS